MSTAIGPGRQPVSGFCYRIGAVVGNANGLARQVRRKQSQLMSWEPRDIAESRIFWSLRDMDRCQSPEIRHDVKVDILCLPIAYHRSYVLYHRTIGIIVCHQHPLVAMDS